MKNNKLRFNKSNHQKEKKAQASIFIIIGLIAVIIMGFSVYYASQKPASIVSEKPSTLKEFVERCVYDTAFNGIMLLGVQGGRLYESDDVNNLNNLNSVNNMLDVKSIGIDGSVAYGYYENGLKLLSSEQMQAEINKYVNNALPFCIKNFKNFPQQVAEQGAISTDTMIALDKVIITLSFPLKYGSDSTNIQTIDKFVVDVPIRLGYVRELARLIIVEQMKQPDLVDFTFLSELSDGTFNASELATFIPDGYSLNDGMEEGINIIPVDADNFLLAINDSGFVFLSAFKFKENKAPNIIFDETLGIIAGNISVNNGITEIHLKDGEEFVYQLKAEDDDVDEEGKPDVIFTDETGLFDITEEGLIEFTPEIPGEYDVAIIATDPHGNYDKQIVKFIVGESFLKQKVKILKEIKKD